ncbi:MAG: murein biosynthesis integral membrane protein MurJ [Chloroflexi bacterium]|nr:murein biosynthesis integral membrane protein MurJ [Chloroflexota bacterium]
MEAPATETRSPSRFARLAGAALTVSAGNAVGRLLGLAREQTIAALFGRSAATDAFTAASRVPVTTYDLLVGGMISAAFVPVLAAEVEQSERAFWQLAGQLLTLFTLLLALVSVLVVLLADPLVSLLTPAFAPATRALTLTLLQIMAPSLFFLGLSGVAIGILQARRHFAAPAFGAALFNLAFVVAAWLLRERGVEALAIGLVAGSAAQLALQLLALRGAPLRPLLSLRNPALRRIGQLYLPVLLGLVVSSAGVLIDTNLASRLPAGDLTAMRYATTLTQFTLGLVATAIGAAYLPELARLAPHSPAYRAALGEALRAVLTLIVPAALALVILREPVLRLLFQRGEFGSADTARTALAFLTYAPGIPAAALDQILIYAFYARQDTLRPVSVGVLAVGVYLLTALILIDPFGMVGLALANSAQWTSHLLMMAVLTWLVVRPLPWRSLVLPLARVTCAVLPASAIWWLSLPLLPTPALLLLPALLVVGVVGAAVYLATLWLLRAPEVIALWQRFPRRRTPSRAVS